MHFSVINIVEIVLWERTKEKNLFELVICCEITYRGYTIKRRKDKWAFDRGHFGVDESAGSQIGDAVEVINLQMGVAEQATTLGHDDPMRYLIEKATGVNKDTIVLRTDSI